MKKRLFFVSCLMFFAAVSANGQEKRRLTYGDADLKDVVSALDKMKVNIRKIYLPVNRDESFKVTLFIEEYENGELKKETPIGLQPTRMEIRYREDTEFRAKVYNQITAIIDNSGNGRTMFYFICEGIQSGGYPLDIKEEHAFYSVRPFLQKDFVFSEKVPVLMYGASWFDEKFKICRFCGSREVDYEMEDELFKFSPHYFIIKVKLEPNADYIVDLMEG